MDLRKKDMRYLIISWQNVFKNIKLVIEKEEKN